MEAPFVLPDLRGVFSLLGFLVLLGVEVPFSLGGSVCCGGGGGAGMGSGGVADDLIISFILNAFGFGDVKPIGI